MIRDDDDLNPYWDQTRPYEFQGRLNRTRILVNAISASCCACLLFVVGILTVLFVPESGLAASLMVGAFALIPVVTAAYWTRVYRKSAPPAPSPPTGRR